MYYRPAEIENFFRVIKDNKGFAFLALLLIIGVLWFNYSQYFRLRQLVNHSKQLMSSIYLVIVILNVFYILVSSQSPIAETTVRQISSYHTNKVNGVLDKLNVTGRHTRNVTNLQKKMVAANQQWKCGQCGQTLDETYEVDHIKPLCEGGTNELSNLMALDPICHKKKTLQSYLK